MDKFSVRRTDEVKTRPRVVANVGDDKVVVAGGAADVRVQRTRPELPIRGQLEFGLQQSSAHQHMRKSKC